MSLRLIRFDYPLTQDELNESLLYKLTEEELNWSLKIDTEIPTDSESSDSVWDIFLIDDENLNTIETILNKYKIDYESKDISDELFDSNINKFFRVEIDNFLLDNWEIDTVLDRISEVSIDNISPVEKYYLQIYNKSIFF
jgi:predicted restriction endonuclease